MIKKNKETHVSQLMRHWHLLLDVAYLNDKDWICSTLKSSGNSPCKYVGLLVDGHSRQCVEVGLDEFDWLRETWIPEAYVAIDAAIKNTWSDHYGARMVCSISRPFNKAGGQCFNERILPPTREALDQYGWVNCLFEYWVILGRYKISI